MLSVRLYRNTHFLLAFLAGYIYIFCILHTYFAFYLPILRFTVLKMVYKHTKQTELEVNKILESDGNEVGFESAFLALAQEIADSWYYKVVNQLNQSTSGFEKSDYINELFCLLMSRTSSFRKILTDSTVRDRSRRFISDAYCLARGPLIQRLFSGTLVQNTSIDDESFPSVFADCYQSDDSLNECFSGQHASFSDASPSVSSNKLNDYYMVECLRGLLPRRQFELLKALSEGETTETFADATNFSSKSVLNLSYELHSRLKEIANDNPQVELLTQIFKDSVALHAA